MEKEQKKERRPYKVFEQQAETCLKEWNRALPYYQQMIDQGKEIGIEINHAMIIDLVNHKGRETVQILTTNATEQAKKTGITDPQIIKSLVGNPAERIQPLLKTAEMLNYIWQTSFVPQILRGSLSSNYLTIEGGKVTLTDSSFEEIKAEYFMAYIETPEQEKVMQLAQQAAPVISELFNFLRKYDSHISLQSVFNFDYEAEKFELNPFILNLVNPEKN